MSAHRPRGSSHLPPTHLASGSASSDAVLAAQHSFRTLLEVSPALAILHRNGTVIYANPAALRASGVSDGEGLVGTPLADLFHVDDAATVNSRLMAPPANTSAGSAGIPRGGHESFKPRPGSRGEAGDLPPRSRPGSGEAGDLPSALRWRRRDPHGGYRITEAVAAPADFEGAPAVLVVARDVTERAESQHALLQRDRMAALGTLSAGVAHEINNPLTYMLVNLEHVLRRLRAASASDDPIAELANGSGTGGLTGLAQSLQQAVEGANRVRQIVRSLLTFSQGNVEQRGVADVRGIVESAVQMAWHELRHRARLVKSLGDVPPVEANEARLGQVFLNLLVNAAQAIPEGHADRHEVRVATRTDARGNAIVEVGDTGVGISTEDLPRIFDPFFTTKGDAGTGLGLSISMGTVRVLGGDILVDSTPGRGSTFRVVLPPAKPWRVAPPSSTHDARSGRPAHLAQRRVLVIDDERLVGDAIARALSEENHVEVVTDAQEALTRIAAGQTYDVVLCDLMMPVVTGMDLYAEVLRAAPKMAGRIVFMTGGAFTPRARAFLESIGNPCLEKPIDMGKLRSLLAKAGRS
jgi:signal transduction histidine kinase